MQDNEMIWGDSVEDLQKIIPGCVPLSFTFISANVYSNPVLMKRQPEYVAWLEGQDRETKEALLYGNWYVTKQTEGIFKRKYIPVIDFAPYFARRYRGFDFAGSIKDEINKDPDYTATVLLTKTKEGKYCIEHAHRMRERFHDVEEWLLELSRTEADDIVYVIPVDSGSAGKAYARTLQQKLAETGRFVILHNTGQKSKMIRARPFASVCQSGAVSMVSAAWNDWLMTEWEQFIGDGKTHEDSLDAAVSAFWAMNQGLQLPDFTIPNIQAPSVNYQFGFQSTVLPSSQGLPQNFN